MSKKLVIAMDLGGTNLRSTVVDNDGKILYRAKRETPKNEEATKIINTIVESAKDCYQTAESRKEISTIALVVPGTVDVENGIIIKAPNLPALNNFNISEILEGELNLTCILENDANAAAIGENWLGASRDFESSICVTLGTGVGGGIIIDGKVLRGIDGTAAEIGHICVEPFGAPCGCGSRGCFEQYASASAVVRLARELAEKYPGSVLKQASSLIALDIYEAAKTGDKLALEVFHLQGFYLGIALAGLINVLNPEVIVIGGGSAAGWDLFAPEMFEQIRVRAFRQPAERAKIVLAECGDDAGILGAARLAFESLSEH